ncbi:MAG TPA: hypothetical protein VF773_09920 [Verrucomicrobiae bacterium]
MYRLHLASWEEGSFIGKSPSDLRLFLSKKDVNLYPAPETRIDPAGEGKFRPNQELLEFQKGNEYRWFILGTAVNIGYVIVENRTNGPIIIEIIRGSSVDAL